MNTSMQGRYLFSQPQFTGCWQPSRMPSFFICWSLKGWSWFCRFSSRRTHAGGRIITSGFCLNIGFWQFICTAVTFRYALSLSPAFSLAHSYSHSFCVYAVCVCVCVWVYLYVFQHVFSPALKSLHHMTAPAYTERALSLQSFPFALPKITWPRLKCAPLLWLQCAHNRHTDNKDGDIVTCDPSLERWCHRPGGQGGGHRRVTYTFRAIFTL